MVTNIIFFYLIISLKAAKGYEKSTGVIWNSGDSALSVVTNLLNNIFKSLNHEKNV